MEFQEDALERAKRVKLIIFDVDGVLTDGGIYIGADGELFKPFFCRDGLGITLAHRAGLKTAIITGRQSEHLRYRAKELHITEVYQGNLDKREAYKDLKAKLGLADEEIAYFGDDLVDAGLFSDRLRGALIVSGQHDHTDSHVLQFFYCLRTVLFYNICHCDHAEKLPAFCKKKWCFSFSCKFFCLLHQFR